MIARAQQGRYSQFEVQRGLPINQLLHHFTQTGDAWRLNAAVRHDGRLQNLESP
jgi:chemotaxis protein methyltransferase CheR